MAITNKCIFTYKRTNPKYLHLKNVKADIVRKSDELTEGLIEEDDADKNHELYLIRLEDGTELYAQLSEVEPL